MIDGIKAILKDNLVKVRNNPLLDFQLSFCSSISTGEVKQGKSKYPIAKYHSLVFEDKGSVIEVRGSIHKMLNQGQHNHDQFGLSSIHLALYKLADQLSVVTNTAELKNIEFGVNLIVGFEPKNFLNSIIVHKGRMFTLRTERNMQFRECIHSQYYIKVYDKGLQFSLNSQILRFELKYIKMEKINELGIKYLSDLLDPKKLEKLQNVLLNVFDEILIGDINTNAKTLSTKDQVLFANGHNPNFWDSILPRTVNFKYGSSDKQYKRELKSYQRKVIHFKELLHETGGDNLKVIVRDKISIVSTNLLKENKNRFTTTKKCPKLTGMIQNQFLEKCPELTGLKILSQCPEMTPCFIVSIITIQIVA